MVDELLVDTLKNYVPVKDWDLHDWETIISRRIQYNEHISIYPLVYADLYLTDELEYYSFEPKQPNYSFIDNKINSDELVVNELKSYVPSNEIDLHNWDVIIERRETYNKDYVSIYPLVYADLYLTDELEYYSFEPKQPNNQCVKKPSDEDSELIIDVLCDYIPLEYREFVDWVEVLARKKTIKKNLTSYKINNIEFYLDDELNVVEYSNVHIIDNKIYYDMKLDSSIQYAPYIFFSEL